MGKEQKDSGRAMGIVAFFTLFMAIMTFNLIVFPACALSTMEVLGVGQAELTTLTSVTSVVGVFGGIIFGRMLDTKDVRKSIMTFMAIGVVLFFVRAFMTSYIPVMILTFLASFCVGICQVAGPKVVATWFPPENVGTAMSFLNAGAGIGSALGFAVGGILGIKNAMLLVGILYLALLIFWLVIGGEGPYKMEMPPVQNAGNGSGAVYKSKNLWMIIIAFSMAVTSSQLVNSYMINSFVSKGLSPASASAMGTALNLSLLIGGFIMTAILNSVKKFMDITTLKFLVVGVVNTLVGTGLMFVLYNIFSVNYWISSASNYIVGSIVSYFLNKYFTFQNKERSAKQVIRFIVNITLCYLIAYGLAKPAVSAVLSGMSEKVQGNCSMLVGMCLFVALNYLGQRFFVFKKE